MAHIEIQIANTALLQSLKQLLTPRLYTECFVSPVTGLILDHLEPGTIGPAVPTPAGLTVPIRVGVFVVNVEDVIAANGGAASPAIDPAPQLTGNILLTIVGTTLMAVFDSIAHDNDGGAYENLLTLVASFTNGGRPAAQMLFDQWEAAVKTNLNSSPLLVTDFKTMLPPQFTSVPFGRSALSADGDRVAVRLETGALNSDGDWRPTFLKGILEDRLLAGCGKSRIRCGFSTES